LKWKEALVKGGRHMNLELKQANQLPVRTWSWLKVNELELQQDIPDSSSYNKNPLKNKELSQAVQLQYKKWQDDLASISTGMGKEAEEFIKNHKNTGISLYLPKGVKQMEPVMLEYCIDEENPSIIEYNEIILEEDTEITVVVNYKNKAISSGFHGSLTYIKAGKNAVIHLIQAQVLDDSVTHLNNIGAVLEEGSTVQVTLAELGAGTLAGGVMAELSGDNSNFSLNTIYLGDKSRSIDFNYVMNHHGKHTVSEMNINGALMDTSKKLFRGTIDFKKGAKGAVGQQSEYNLLFSPGIKNVSAPLILCGEDDVEGKHAANSGKIDENVLFYMMSRGLDELTAKRVILEAWFEPVIQKIPDEELQGQLLEYVKERLDHVKSI